MEKNKKSKTKKLTKKQKELAIKIFDEFVNNLNLKLCQTKMDGQTLIRPPQRK